jgi:5'-nucleotidase / UDP-sugar diphosphatase
MFKRVFWLAFLLASLTISTLHAQETYALTVMHTNDTHAQHEPDGDGNGGVALQAAVVEQIRAEVANAVLLDAGDRFTGSIFHTFYRGADNAQIMNALGYDAMLTGSYEYTHGAETLANFVDALEFPVVVANVDFSASPELEGRIPPYVILDVGGQQIGVLGVTRADARVRPIPSIVFSNDYVAVVQSAIDDLNAQGVNKIILLSHLGYFDDLDIATELSGVDIIVGSDSNTLLSNTLADAEGPYPAVTESATGEAVLVVQAFQRNQVLGRLDAEFDADGVLVSWGGDAVALTVDITPDPDMAELVAQLREPLGDFLSQTVGETTVFLEGAREVCRFEECNLGSLIADAMRSYTGAQIALHNGGGIRASISAGDISAGSVFDVLPFSNTVVTFELSGIDIVAALENGVSRIDSTEGTGRFLQVSGLRFAYDGSRAAGQRVTNVEVMDEDGDFDDFGDTLDQVVREYIAANSPLSLAVEGRITRVDR